MKTGRNWAKLIAVFLIAQMICGMIPSAAYASEGTDEQVAAVLDVGSADAESQPSSTEPEPVIEETPVEMSGDSQSGGVEVIVDPGEGGDANSTVSPVIPEIPAQNEIPAPVTDGTGTDAQDGGEPVPVPAADGAQTTPANSTGTDAQDGGEPVPAPAADGAQSTPAKSTEVPENTEKQAVSGTEELQEENMDTADAPVMPAFDQFLTVDGSNIMVKALEGVFPADAMLSVEKIPETDTLLAEAKKAVDAARPEGQNPAISYTYDIKVLDAAGQVIQPAAGQVVEVSFATAQVNDHNLSANIYHITRNETTGELAAEKLNAVTDEMAGTVKAETAGFSLYTVEFTYNDLTYVLEEGAAIRLAEILTAVGLEGEAEAVSVSNGQILSASNESGEWVVSALQALDTEETLLVTIRGIVYEIAVSGKKADGASADVKVQGKSLTQNIVGDVFVNMLGASKDSELAAKREASLLQYPLEHHDDLSYYGDSLRVRYLDGGDADGPNYLVYRDSYLLISQEDSANYTVTSSKDGLTAYITPAIPAEQLQGKIGVVFLGKDVSVDNILVFAGEPVYDGGTMIVTLKRTEDIMVNELFSDGKLVPEQQAQPTRKNSMLKSGIGPVHWETEPKGKNWKGEITRFSPSWPDPHYKINVWDLVFELGLNLTFDMDFHITTDGTSGKLETTEIAKIDIPIKYVFAVGMTYSLVTEFDDTPMEIEGTLTTNFDFDIGIYGTMVKNYRTPVKIKKLKVDPDNTQAASKYCNKEIKFYIGSELSANAKCLYISIDVGLFDVELGPVLKLTVATQGGCDITAKQEKDLYAEPLDTTNRDEIHTCTKNGASGCLDIQVQEKNNIYVKVTLDLYFDDWDWDPYNPGWKQVGGPKEYYKSETFDGRDSEVKEGICPHRFFRVPVRVWLDDRKTRPAPEGMDVTVSDSLNVTEAEKDLTCSKTDNNGEASLFLPYKSKYCYNLVASGILDGKPVAGANKQPVYMQAKVNDPVDIILKSEETIRVKTNVIWNADADGKDIPSTRHSLQVVLYRRRAGTTDDW